MKVLKSSQKLIAELPAVSFIDWLGLRVRTRVRPSAAEPSQQPQKATDQKTHGDCLDDRTKVEWRRRCGRRRRSESRLTEIERCESGGVVHTDGKGARSALTLLRPMIVANFPYPLLSTYIGAPWKYVSGLYPACRTLSSAIFATSSSESLGSGAAQALLTHIIVKRTVQTAMCLRVIMRSNENKISHR
jgi:hypothetical protein